MKPLGDPGIAITTQHKPKQRHDISKQQLCKVNKTTNAATIQLITMPHQIMVVMKQVCLYRSKITHS